MVSFAPARFDLVDDLDDITIRRAIPCGATYYLRLHGYDLLTVGGVLGPPIDYSTLDDLDFSAFVGANKGARCNFRTSQFAPGAPLATPTVAIVGGGTTGELDFTIDSVQAALLQNNRRGYYDIELYDNTVSPPIVQRVLEGIWNTTAEVTHPNT